MELNGIHKGALVGVLHQLRLIWGVLINSSLKLFLFWSKNSHRCNQLLCQIPTCRMSLNACLREHSKAIYLRSDLVSVWNRSTRLFLRWIGIRRFLFFDVWLDNTIEVTICLGYLLCWQIVRDAGSFLGFERCFNMGSLLNIEYFWDGALDLIHHCTLLLADSFGSLENLLGLLRLLASLSLCSIFLTCLRSSKEVLTLFKSAHTLLCFRRSFHKHILADFFLDSHMKATCIFPLRTVSIRTALRKWTCQHCFPTSSRLLWR